jgi:hypothetical protein
MTADFLPEWVCPSSGARSRICSLWPGPRQPCWGVLSEWPPQRQGLLFFSVDHEHLLRGGRDRPHVRKQIVPVRMGRQSIKDDHLSAARRRDSENRHDIPSFNQSAPQRMFGLKAHDGDDVGFVLDAMFEMVHDAPPSHMPEEAMITQGPFISFSRLLSSGEETYRIYRAAKDPLPM